MSELSLTAFDKPSGVSTHSPEKNASEILGFMEAASQSIKQELFIVHRLDKGTSGVLLAANDQASAETLRAAFEKHLIQKKYFFVSDRSFAREHFHVRSWIEKKGSAYTSTLLQIKHNANSDKSSEKPFTDQRWNAETRIELVKSFEKFSLWQAIPLTGKTHQIRFHAEACGLAILGDREHGGSPAPRLMLHNAELKVQTPTQELDFQSEVPCFFNELHLLNDTLLLKWLVAIDRRKRWLKNFAQENLTSLRWIHTDGDFLRVDQLDDVFILQWFKDNEPTKNEWQAIQALLQTLNAKKWMMQLRHDRGKSSHQQTTWQSEPPPEARWIAHENHLAFEMRLDSGLSSGLFLDQRQNRNWIMANAKDKHVLNLFSYTSGFSVAAAKGGASRVVSVDLSKTFLEWSKKNFALNQLEIRKPESKTIGSLSPSSTSYEFVAMDSLAYLRWAHKKQFQFDLIVCDPPSFSRGPEGIFRIEDQIGAMLELLNKVLAPQGYILFSCNYEKWSQEKWNEILQKEISKKRLPLKITNTPSPDWDFELPKEDRILKSSFLIKT